MNLERPDLVVLCGGRGTRLRPATDTVPKALVELDGRPIIDHLFEYLTAKGLKRVHLCIGYKGEMIRRHFEAREGNISFSDLGENASMLARIFALRDDLADRFLIAYSDTFIDLDIDELLAHHASSGAQATIVAASIRNPFGILKYDTDGTVTSFEEKPVQKHFIGYTLMQRTAFERISEEMLRLPDGEGLIALFNALIRDGALSAYEHDGLNITFNTVSERVEMEYQLQRYYTLVEPNGS